MFQGLGTVRVEAAGSGSGSGPGPPTAVTQVPTDSAVETVAPRGPARGGMGATHAGPAGPELPQGQGYPPAGGDEMLVQQGRRFFCSIGYTS